jgi:hypothetical protein
MVANLQKEERRKRWLWNNYQIVEKFEIVEFILKEWLIK